MIYLILGFSIAINIALVIFIIYLFKSNLSKNIDNKLYENIESIKKVNDPFKDLFK